MTNTHNSATTTLGPTVRVTSTVEVEARSMTADRIVAAALVANFADRLPTSILAIATCGCGWDSGLFSEESARLFADNHLTKAECDAPCLTVFRIAQAD